MQFFLKRSPWLKSYPNWIDSSIMRLQLLQLLNELKTPELYLILEANTNNSYSWKRFGKPSKTQNSKQYPKYIIEEAVVNIYLAYLAQMCQDNVFTADGTLMARDVRYVLCPKALLDYIENSQSHTICLREVLKTADVVRLTPGAWQNRGKVLQWQASLAVWRKQGKQFEPMLVQAVEHPPQDDSETDQLPAYSKNCQPPAY